MAVGRGRGFLKQANNVRRRSCWNKTGKRFDFVLSFQHVICTYFMTVCDVCVPTGGYRDEFGAHLIKNRPFRDPVSRCAWLN